MQCPWEEVNTPWGSARSVFRPIRAGSPMLSALLQWRHPMGSRSNKNANEICLQHDKTNGCGWCIGGQLWSCKYWGEMAPLGGRWSRKETCAAAFQTRKLHWPESCPPGAHTRLRDRAGKSFLWGYLRARCKERLSGWGL